jgi:OOP family OmpA-OmpF porin
LLLGSSAAFAHQVALDGDIELGDENAGGYVSSDGMAIRTGEGDCLRLGDWSEDSQNNACEGIEETAAEPEADAEPEAEKAPAPEPVKKEPIITTATLGGEALFDTNSDALGAASEEALGKLLTQLAKFQEISAIDISGHTDSRGAEDYNQGLSMRRADAVKAFLAAAYPNVAISAEGLGETSPVATNSTPEGRQQNRRVEIQVTAKSVTQP